MPGELIPILLGLGLFALLLGLRYLQNKETMALIQNGMDPKLSKATPQPYKNLKWGLLILGSGLGLFIAFLLNQSIFNETDGMQRHHNNAIIYFAMLGIFGGLGLIVSFIIEKKALDKA